MYLLYYNKKDGSKSWIMSRDIKTLNDYVEENEKYIADYCITIDEFEYERMMNKIKIYEEQMDSVKIFINNTFERR